MRRSGCVDVGDVICCVNGVDVTQMPQRDVTSLLEMTSRYPRRPIVLTLRRSAARSSGKLLNAYLLEKAVLFCSLAFLDPRVGHTMDVLSPFTCISIFCHSD